MKNVLFDRNAELNIIGVLTVLTATILCGTACGCSLPTRNVVQAHTRV